VKHPGLTEPHDSNPLTQTLTTKNQILNLNATSTKNCTRKSSYTNSLPAIPCCEQQVVALAWSDDSSQVAIVEKSGLTSLFSLRMDKHLKPVIDSAGAFAPCKLTPLGTFGPVR
jgi:hypothetical protein